MSNLAGLIFHGNEASIAQQPVDTSGIERVKYRGFVKPQETLERSLESNREKGSTPLPRKRPNYRNVDSPTEEAEEEGGGFFTDGSEKKTAADEEADTMEKIWVHQDDEEGTLL